MPGGWRGGMSTTGIDLLLTSLTYVTGVKRYCSTYCYKRYKSWCRCRVHMWVTVCPGTGKMWNNGGDMPINE